MVCEVRVSGLIFNVSKASRQSQFATQSAADMAQHLTQSLRDTGAMDIAQPDVFTECVLPSSPCTVLIAFDLPQCRWRPHNGYCARNCFHAVVTILCVFSMP